MTKLVTALVVATLALVAPTYAQSACSISDIAIKQHDWRIDSDDGNVRFVGEIINQLLAGCRRRT
jgi:hypothetical protein